MMTENRRIFWNVVATYGRSLFTMGCGLFTSRWVLMTLGEVDYGLYGVVGGLTVCIGFLNGLLSNAVGRFYAFSVGQARVAGTQGEGLEVCRQWFNSALAIHCVVPLALMAVGYPIGEHAVRAWLTIPPERVEACVWVFRIVCVTSLVGMMSVPFRAMYEAKQYIAELTIYSFVTATLNVCVLYYMVSHPGDWLTRYALWTAVLAIAPMVIIAVRAVFIFPELRFRPAYLWDWRRTRALVYFAGAEFFGCLGVLLRGQGVMIVVNKYFGPATNAAMTVATSVSNHCNTLNACLQGAFLPAITNACGARDYGRMLALTYRTCTIGSLLVLLFALPLALEIDEVLRLWLKHPPEYAAGLSLLMLATLVVDRLGRGSMLALNANGKVMAYQLVSGTLLILTFPAAWLFVALGFGVYSIGWAFVIFIAAHILSAIWFARKLVRFSFRHWVRSTVLPIAMLTAICGAAGTLPRLWMEPSLWRVAMTTLCCEAILLPLAWGLVLTPEERAFVREKLRQALGRLARKE